MTNSVLSVLEQRINDLCGEDVLLEPSILTKSGICTSQSSARCLLRQGKIPSLKLSPGRILIAKNDILNFLKNCSEVDEK